MIYEVLRMKTDAYEAIRNPIGTSGAANGMAGTPEPLPFGLES